MTKDTIYDLSDIAIPPDELLKYMILRRRDDVLRKFEKYYRYKFARSKPPTNEIRSKLLEFFSEIGPMYKNTKKLAEYNAVKDKIMNVQTPVEELLKTFERLNDFLYDKRIIKVDVRTRHDPARIEDENAELDS